jgi:AcrR family transcriptional regulator
MSDTVLTPEKILEAAEDVLRRFGPSKTTVVDVARALGVSHGSVYRHFPSKAALRDAVAEKWLAHIHESLLPIVDEGAPAPEKLRHWFDELIAIKRSRALEDPELFANYLELAADSREVIIAHVEHLIDQIRQILMDGITEFSITPADADSTARAMFDATARFHKPTHASEWSNPSINQAFEGVWTLMMKGISR